jgi:hypothetical protein
MGYNTEFEGKFTFDKGNFLSAEQAAGINLLEDHQTKLQKPNYACDWEAYGDGHAIEWNGNEKFSNSVEWIEFIIEEFLKPWGKNLNGTVRYRGEDFDDVGSIIIKDNVISILFCWSGEQILWNERHDIESYDIPANDMKP